jgi:RNA polymerase sigma-70 factor, ECF subfamily
MSVAIDFAAPAVPAVGAGDPDAELLEALRRRDEDAYLLLVRRHTPLMMRVARRLLPQQAAEDAVQDTWVAVLRSLDRFEGRSLFRTWLMRILVNTARTRRLRDSRTVCWSSLPEDAPSWDAVTRGSAASEPPGPERRVLAGETWTLLHAALDRLPDRQRTVVVLRDVEGWTSDEVREALRLSAGNQRVLLHRGRARLRELLSPYAAAWLD